MQLHDTLWNHVSYVIPNEILIMVRLTNPCSWPQSLHAKQLQFGKWSETTDISYITPSCKFRNIKQQT
jgi:hypothetical protein